MIDPEVQAEAPCVEGTRIPTRVVAERAAVEPDDDFAFDLDLSAIEAAILFEELLAKGTGGPAFIRALIHEADNRPTNASSKRRHPSTRQKRVVKERDRSCVDCGATTLLEYDHVPDFARTGHTVVEELQLRCGPLPPTAPRPGGCGMRGQQQTTTVTRLTVWPVGKKCHATVRIPVGG